MDLRRPIGRVTIFCLFLRFVLIFKGSVLQSVNVMCLFLRNVLIFESRAYYVLDQMLFPLNE